MRVYFEASSILASYNLDLPKALSSEADVYVDIEHSLLYAIYLYEKLYRRYGTFKAIPPYIGRFVRGWVMRRADVVHLNSLNTELARRAKELGKPVVAVLHAAPFPREVYEAINDYVDVYVAPSNFTRQGEETKIGSKRIVVIHHGVDMELFNPGIPPELARRKLGIPLDARIILWNDRISPEKDLETFIAAAEHVLREVKEAYIYIKGRAIVKHYYERIKPSLKALLKTGRVKLHMGWVPHSRLPLLYRVADVFVRTSKYENFGLGAVEAMACGVPVVAPNATTFPEIVGDNVTLYKPGDPVDLAGRMIILLLDDNLYKSVLRRQLVRVHRLFKMDIVAKKYLKLYTSLT
jgi:glycosyltransferase involved in cell wall biosynthesis